MKVRIGKILADEYAGRMPDGIPTAVYQPGTHHISGEKARALLRDAEFNSDRRCVDVGLYGMPVATFRAYGRLAAQLRKALA
jgi:hypothetical protein